MKFEETARRLRDALSKAGLSQQELADKSGVNKSSISQYINGTHTPGNKKAGQLAEVLNCSPMWLMGFDSPQEENAADQLDRMERKIIEVFRSLSDKKKVALYEYIKSLIE